MTADSSAPSLQSAAPALALAQQIAGVRLDAHYVPMRLPAGTVSRTWGSALVRKASGELLPVQPGDLVEKGDVILTTQDGIVEITADPQAAAARPVAYAAGSEALAPLLAELDLGELEFEAPAAGVSSGGEGDSGLQSATLVERVIEVVTPQEYAYATTLATSDTVERPTDTIVVETSAAPAPADTNVTVQLSGPASVVEGQTSGEYTVTLSETALTEVTITLVYGGSASAGTDYVQQLTVTVPAGQRSATFTLPTLDDALAEGAETIQITLGEVTGGGYASIAADPQAGSITTTLIDDTGPASPAPAPAGAEDTVTISLTGPGTVVEGQVATGYTVQLSQAAATDLTVQLTYSGTATDGSDYTKVVSVTVPAGSTSTSFDISALDDALADNGEAFTVALSAVTGGGFETVAVDPVANAVTTIISDDAGPAIPGGTVPGTEDTATISLTGPGTVVEGQVATGYTVHLSQPAATDLTVQLTYSGTATDGSDYTKVVSVTVPAGSASTSFDITTIDDALADNGESFTVTLGAVTGGGFEAVAVDPTAASVTTIISDDIGPGVPGGGMPGTEDTVTIGLTGPGTVVEGEVATGYTVHLSQPAATDLTVQLTYSGTATDGSDYTKVVSVTVPAGSASTSFDLATLDDALAEGSESVTVTLGTITGGGFEAVAVDPTAASVTTVISDDVGPGIPGGGTPGTEDTVTISLTGLGTVVEGEVASGYTVHLSQPAATDLTVQLTYSGTATDGSDYTKVVSVTVLAGSASTSFDITTLDDALADNGESFTVTLGAVTGGGFEAVAVDPTAASVTTIISDDIGPGVPGGGTPDAEDTVTISLTGPGTVVEGEVATGYTVHLSQPAATDLTVQLTYSGTATDGSDYTKVVSVTVPAGSASTSFDLATLDDALAEGSESVTVTLGTVTGGGFEAVAVDPTAGSITTVIADDVGPDAPGVKPGPEDTVSISLTGPGTVVEGEVATGYTVHLSQPAATNLTVQLTYSGTATDGSDYTKVVSVTVPAGSASTTFDIATIDDALADNGEAFTVTLGTITDGGFEAVAVDPTAASVTTVIADDVGPGVPGGGTPGSEDTVTISLTGPGTVVEGEVATGYTVHLSQPAATDLTVQLTYSGTATDGSDYTKVVLVTVPAGSASTSFDLATLDDALAEGSEFVTVTLGTITGGGFEAVTVDPTAASVTTIISDDIGPGVPGGGTPGSEDTVTISLTGPGTVVEGEVATGYTVHLSQPAATDLTVQLTYSGTATDGSDYTKVVSVTVPAGSASTSFDLATLDDALAEGSESITVTLGTITGGGFEAVAADPVASSVTTVISDDVGPGVPGGGTPGTDDTVSISLTGPGTVVEGEVATGYTVQLSQPAATDLTVQLTYSGTATDGSDYTKVISVTVPAGSASTSFDLATLDDALAEGSESVTVTLGTITGGGFEAVAVDPTAGSITTVIVDDVGPDAPGVKPGPEDTVTISLTGPGTVVEGEVATGYTVQLSQPAATDLTVQLTYSGTATDGSDYTKVISVTVPAGSASTSFDITTLDDALADNGESFTVTLGAVTGGGFEAVAVDPTAASVTTVISDDVGPGIPGGGTPGTEDTVTISLTGPGTVVEGEVATGYTVHLSHPAATDLTVQLTYSGTATDGSDYTEVVSVTVPAGSASTTFDIATIDDALADNGESFTVTLGTITGGGFEAVAVDPTAASVTTVISDDVGPGVPGGGTPGTEDTVTISLTGPGTVVEGEVASGYTVHLSQPAATDLTVQLTYSGTATDGSDYTKVVSVTVPAGSASTTFDIATIDDALADNGESFTVTLGAVTGGGFEAVAVDPTAASVTTVISDDVGPGIPGGGTPGTEDTVTISLTGPGTVVEGQVATGYTVQLSQSAATDLTVQLTYSGTATDGSDYTKVVSVTVPAGSASTTFDITTIDDALADNGEAFTVTLGAVTGGGFEAVAVDPTAASVTTIISDDIGPGVPGGGTPDAEDTVTISLTGPGTVVEGEVATGYTVHLSQPAATDLTVQLTYSGTATDGSDYTKVVSVTVPAGSASTSFDLATLDDALAEGSESITVTLGTITGGGFEAVAVDPTAGSITTVIVDDVGPDAPGVKPGPDDTVTISLTGPGTVVEGEVATGYTVHLSQPAATDLTVQLTYSGTATDSSDYTKVVSVTVPAGSASTSFDITTLDDALADNGESFTVTLGTITGGGFEVVAVDPTAASVTTVIADDVGPGVPGGGTPGSDDTVTISLTGPGTVVEGEVATGYTVHLSQPAATDLTVQLTYSGTATDGSDYTKVVSVTVPAGSASTSFDLATLDDALAEGSESITVTLGTITGGGFEAVAVDPTAGSITTVIADDIGPGVPGGGTPGAEDTVTISLTGPGSVVEGEVATGYTVHLSQPAATDLTVQLTYSGTATDGSDYTKVASVTVPAGSASTTFDITTLDDALADNGESFTVTLGTTTGGGFEVVAVDPTAASVTTVIADDVGPGVPGGGTPGSDDTVTISLTGPGTVVEGEVATGYTVQLSQPAATDLTVQLTYSGTATDGSDYTKVVSVTVPAGSASTTFDITTIDDALADNGESFTVTLGAVTGGGFEAVAVDPTAASVTTVITDDVGPGVPGGGTPGSEDTVTISLTGPGTVVEGEVATGYTVHLSQPAATDLTVQLTYSGTATDGSDYTKVVSVTVPAGSASTSFDITTLDDALADNGESFTVTLGAVTGGGFEAVAVDPVASSVTTVISDDVGPGVPGGGTPGAEDTVTISLTGPGTVVEGEVACGYTVHLSQPAASEVTVELIYSGTATDGSDFSKVVSVTIPAGSASADFDIATIDDALVERGESFIVGIGGTSGGGFEALAVDPVANAVTTAIVDDAGPAAPGGPGAPGVEDTVLVSISGPGSVIEGETAGGYTVCLSHAAATDMTVQLIYTGTATNGEDFQAVVSVTIPAGSASAAFEVPTLDDALAEVGERFTIAVGGTTGGGFEEVAVDPAANAVTTTIVDDAGPDLPPGSPPAGPEDTVLIGISGPDQVGEGEVETGYVVHLSQAAVTDLTVQLTYGGTATDGSDYVRVATVTIPAGASSVGFDLATLPDGRPEGAECIVIGIGATHGGGFEVLAVDGSAAQVVTAVVDPAAAPQISGPLDVRISEEGLAQGLADGTGARAGDDTGNSRSVHGQLTLSDADSASLQVTLTAPTTGLSCGGQPVVWTGDGTGTLVGHIGSATGAVALSITIDASGAYDVTLDAALDHALQGEDLLSLDVGVRVSDGTHTSTATLTVGIEDDAPTASHSTATLLVRHDSIRISQMDAGFSDDTYRNNDCDVSRSDTDSHDGNIDRLRWGQPANDQNRQSGYDLVDSTRFTTATGAAVEAGEVFKLADFTHRNYAIASGSSTLKETDLDLTMAVEINGVSTQVTFTAHLVHTETPNSSDAVASRDIIQLPAQTVTVQVNGQDYEVNLLGFKDSSGQLVTEIRTDENTASNTFGLYGSVTPTDLPPDLVGQVQVDAGADGLAAIRWSDTGSAYGTFTGDADGSYTFVMNQATREALAASGEALTQTFTYQVVDRDGDVTTGSVTVALAREETLAPVTLTSTTQTIDSDSIGLGGEYFGYNDNRTGTAHDATFSGATRLHADDGSATLGGNTSTNLNNLADIEHIVEGRNGNTDLVGNAQLSLAGAADATFTMRNVEFGLVAGTDQALFSTDLGQSGSTFASGQTVTGNNLDRFLHGSNAGNASAITATSGMGDSTDAIIRAVGYIDMTGGTYDIRVTGDDGYRLLIGGETVAEVDVNQYVAVRTFTGVDLSDGLQPIEILYWDQGGHASLRIELKPSGAADTDYKVLGSDEYALFAPGEVPVLGAQQDIVESSTNGVWEIRTGQDYTGTSGNDQVTGSDGKDVIRGGAGRDTIDGAQGDDRLEGGSGHDVLTGGQGADVFAWSLADAGTAGAPAHDTVTDFKVATVGGDALDLRDLLQGENHANLTNYLHFETSGSDTVVSISSTGGFAGGYDSSHTDQTITLSGVTLGGGSDMSVVLDLLAKNQLVVDNG